MNYVNGKVENLKIAYVGGGSRGWAWCLMSELASCNDVSGDVYLYDIDYESAKNNELIGNKYNDCEGANSKWYYHAVKTAKEAMTGADFVIISILPGTFDEMESDVHAPEKYGIYQSVGDSSGPGGIVRAMRTVPMFEEIAEYIKEYCPKAWVINYTNPMTLCVKTLYRVFPEIKPFSCCHEVFGTQTLLCSVVSEMIGEEVPDRHEIKVNPVGVNHFTWLTSATYHNIDLFPYYKEFCTKYKDGYRQVDINWMNADFANAEKVKIDLFNKFGFIAAAGDRHLAEFCEGKWYLENPERVAEMKFGLTAVSFRKYFFQKQNEKSQKLRSGEDTVKIERTGEEGVNQIRALLGLTELITNVNIPNVGQIPNLPMGAVVETNAIFRADNLQPVFAGPVPMEIYPLVSRICSEQEVVSDGIAKRDLHQIFCAFANDPLVTCGYANAEKLFKEMIENTKEYLGSYDLDSF